jgi:hypothetical protein
VLFYAKLTYPDAGELYQTVSNYTKHQVWWTVPYGDHATPPSRPEIPVARHVNPPTHLETVCN